MGGLERTKESSPRRDLDIMAQFQILHERRRLRQRLDRIRLEHHVRHRFPGTDRRGDDLREEVQRDLWIVNAPTINFGNATAGVQRPSPPQNHRERQNHIATYPNREHVPSV